MLRRRVKNHTYCSMAGAEAAALARDALEAMRKDMTCELWCELDRFTLRHSCSPKEFWGTYVYYKIQFQGHTVLTALTK